MRILRMLPLAVGVCTAIGCAQHQGLPRVDRCADIPSGYIPEPAGNKVCNWQTAQVASAAIDQQVLYQCDFVAETATLSPDASERVWRTANLNADRQLAWYVEPSQDQNLDSARLESVGALLAELGVPPQVLLATPPALGLRGPQAESAAAALSRSFNSQRGAGASLGGSQGLGTGRGTFR